MIPEKRKPAEAKLHSPSDSPGDASKAAIAVQDGPRKDLRVHTIRGLFWSGIQRTGGQALGLMTFVILSRLLSPTDFGLLALANTYLLVGLLFIEQGVSQSIVQRERVTLEHLDAAFVLSMSLAIGLAVLTLVLAGPLSRVLGEPMLAPILRGVSPVLILGGLRSTQSAILQRQLRFRELAARSTLAEAAAGVIGIAMALAGLGVWSLVGQSLTRGLAGVAVLWRVSTWRPRLKLARRPLSEIAHFGTPVVLDRLANLIQGKADDLIIGVALGATALGFYSVGYRLLTYLLHLMAGTIQAVALPILSRLQSDPARMRRVFLIMLEYLTLGAFPVFVGVAFLAPELVPLMFGPQWTTSIPVMQVLALAGAAKTLPIAASTVLIAVGRPGLQLRLNLVITSAAVIGFLLTVQWGIVAVASVHLIVPLLTAPVHIAALRRWVAIRPGAAARSLAPAVAGTIVMSGVLLIVGRRIGEGLPPAVWMVLQIAIGAAAYLVVTSVLGRQAFRRARGVLREGLSAWPAERRAEDPVDAI